MNQCGARLWASFLAISLLLSLAACGGRDKATAASMHLTRTEGTVSVSDSGGKDVPVLQDLGLYSGYSVDTRSESYAWIDLDDTKLTKLDQNSGIAIRQAGKALEIEVKSGSLFFNVTRPLEDDESLDIRTSTMMIGVRGTCGWVEHRDGLSRVYLLEGEVECSAGNQTVRVSAGEMAELTADKELTVTSFAFWDILDFVLEELKADDDLAQDVLEDSGLDVPGLPGSGPAEGGPLVTDAYSYTLLYQDSYDSLTFEYRIPQINLDSDAARAFNQQIWDTYYIEGRILTGPVPEGYAPSYAGPALQRVTYEWYTRGGVLSLIVHEDHNPLIWAGVFETAYNISLATGGQLSDRQTLEALGYTEDEFYAGVRRSLTAYWDDMRIRYSDMLSSDSSFALQFERCAADTLADGNVRASTPCIGEDGTLWFLGTTMWMAGGGSNVYRAPVG